MDGWMNGQMDDRSVKSLMDGQMNGWLGGWGRAGLVDAQRDDRRMRRKEGEACALART